MLDKPDFNWKKCKKTEKDQSRPIMKSTILFHIKYYTPCLQKYRTICVWPKAGQLTLIPVDEGIWFDLPNHAMYHFVMGRVPNAQSGHQTIRRGPKRGEKKLMTQKVSHTLSKYKTWNHSSSLTFLAPPHKNQACPLWSPFYIGKPKIALNILVIVVLHMNALLI